MGCAQSIDRQLGRFLDAHCPDPALIRCAIARSQLVTITDYLPDETICRRGDRVSGCWLVLSGQIEIRAEEQTVASRGAGELVGEQGLLHVLAGKTGTRTADVKACGSVRLLCIGAENRIAVTILGATVNLAARYEQAKSPDLGQIRLSPHLRDLIVRSGIDSDAFRGPTKVQVKHGVEFDVYSI